LRLVKQEAAVQCAAGDEGADDDPEGDFGGSEDQGGSFDSPDIAHKVGHNAVFLIEHGFLSEEADPPEWRRRGTLALSGAPGSVEARLSDAAEFVAVRPELQGMMSKAAENGSHYAIRMYNANEPKRVLLASVPAKLLADSFEDWHDILQVSLGPTGLPVALSYRIRHTLGLSLFDHTQVRLSESSAAEGPRVPPQEKDKDKLGGKKEEQASGGFLGKYWPLMILAMLVLNFSGGDDGGRGGGGGSGGGGGGGGGGRRGG